MRHETFAPETTELVPNNAERVSAVLADPEKYGVADNVRIWPSHEALDRLPNQFWAEFKDGNTTFAIVRNGKKYIQLPMDMMRKTLSINANLTETNYERLADSDLLPQYGISKANVAMISELLSDLDD